MWYLIVFGLAAGLLFGVLCAALVQLQGHRHLMLGAGMLGGVLGAVTVLKAADLFHK